MIHLLATSLIWAFSFGLIKANLTGLDSNFVAWARLLVALLVFLPFLRTRDLALPLAVRFFVIGLIQYGIMYICLIYSYQFLQAHQVALFTILTPLYVTLINDSLQKSFHPTFLASALLAVLGTGVIVYSQIGQGELLTGFAIIQLSNFCFALGQVLYKQTMAKNPGINDRKVYAILYLGAVAVTGIAAGLSTNWTSLQISGKQIFTLLYLGAVLSCLSPGRWYTRLVGPSATALWILLAMVSCSTLSNGCFYLMVGLLVLGLQVVSTFLRREF